MTHTTGAANTGATKIIPGASQRPAHKPSTTVPLSAADETGRHAHDDDTIGAGGTLG